MIKRTIKQLEQENANLKAIIAGDEIINVSKYFREIENLKEEVEYLKALNTELQKDMNNVLTSVLPEEEVKELINQESGVFDNLALAIERALAMSNEGGRNTPPRYIQPVLDYIFEVDFLKGSFNTYKKEINSAIKNNEISKKRFDTLNVSLGSFDTAMVIARIKRIADKYFKDELTRPPGDLALQFHSKYKKEYKTQITQVKFIKKYDTYLKIYLPNTI